MYNDVVRINLYFILDACVENSLHYSNVLKHYYGILKYKDTTRKQYCKITLSPPENTVQYCLHNKHLMIVNLIVFIINKH